ncbi:MAG TPA: sigma-70 family RNA polymerase sigma factor [Candidatus Limnocylindrales bacterium]|nr:sigma-70 family RNA polymerase sigma factor [Candidatus Limnocylindrales bacterium]
MTFDERSGPAEAGGSGATVAPVRASTRVTSEAVEAVWRRHYSDVYRYVLTLTRSHEDAQEIVSDVFARALDRWSRVPEPPLPWLLVVARRLATDRWRRARRLAAILVSGRRRGAVDGEERPTEFWTWFDSLAAVLTPRQLEVLALRYRHDLTDEQIAEVMALSRSGVRSLVARALDALRSHPELL